MIDPSGACDHVDAPDSTAFSPAAIQVKYYSTVNPTSGSQHLLAAVLFGSRTPSTCPAPLSISVDLAPLNGSPDAELWLASGPVHTGQSGRVRYAYDDHFQFAVVEEDERTHEDVRAATASAYDEIQRFQRSCKFAHVLRMWNYMDSINEGAGDCERYRRFCVGRAQSLQPVVAERFPAATAIGRQQPTGRLQVFWLAGRQPGAAIENPRQVSAYRYPRAHGPVAPSFARATLASDGAVLISGTASIVGHVSHHFDDPLEQLEETLRNLEALTAQAGARHSPQGRTLFKVYVRDPSHAPAVEQRLRERRPRCEVMFLAADICRRELLLEIEAVVTVGG